MKTFFLFFFVILISCFSVYATDDTLTIQNCEELGYSSDICDLIREGAESAEDWETLQKEIIMMLISQGELAQVHSNIHAWNNNLIFDETPPEGETAQSKPCSVNNQVTCIKNAWMKVFSYSHSFLENGSLFFPGLGKLQVGYYYELGMPEDDILDGPECVCKESQLPLNKYGDCKTTFTLTDSSLLQSYMNNYRFFSQSTGGFVYENGDNNLFLTTPQASQQDNNFEAELTIRNDVYATHYSWKDVGSCSECCETRTYCTGSGESRTCRTVCVRREDKYTCGTKEGTTTHTTTLILSDDLDMELYTPPEPTHEIEVSYVDRKPRVYVESDAIDYELLLNRASVKKEGSEYKSTYSYPPYNILALERQPKLQYTSREGYISSSTENSVLFDTYDYNIGDCIITYFYPFPHLDYSDSECNMLEKGATNLEVTTDDSGYQVGDEITVEVDFSSDVGQLSVPVTVTYGDQSKKITTNKNGKAFVTFNAEQGGAQITASYQGDAVQSSVIAVPDSVYVSDKSFGDYVKFGILILVIYGLFYVYRVYGEAWIR